MIRSQRTFRIVPALPSRGIMPPIVGVILPLARTNLITNPSFETNTTGWSVTGGGASIARTAAQQYHGIYSLGVSVANFGASAIYTISLTSGTTYAFSFKLYNPQAGRAHAISINTSLGALLASYNFTSTGRWQWVSIVYTATSTATHQLCATHNTNVVTETFYVDGAQLEAISDGILSPTTYIDGDQQGLLIGQQPPAYLWTGTPHASTSTRSALTRAGGYVVNLSTYNFILSGLVGLGMAAPNNISVPYTVLDGARYQRTQKPPRAIALAGRVQADDYFTYQSSISDLCQAFDRDLVPVQQPLVLTVEPQDDCGNAIGDFANVQCVYAGGLEGNTTNLTAEDVAPTFTMYIPFLVGGDAGAALTVQQSVTNANYILQRSPTGVWSAMGTGGSGGDVRAIVRGLDGKIYAAGLFTSMGGVANTSRIAYWDGAAWNAMGTGANGDVYELVVMPNGDIVAAGDFTLMGGVANTVRIARWNGSAWSALSTGANAAVTALTVAANGDIYAGGNFTTIGGVAINRIAKWNGSAWSALAASGADNTVSALVFNTAGILFAGGNFTNIGGTAINYVAKWNGTAWSAMGSGMNDQVQALAVGPGGLVYAGGNFTTSGGVTTNRIAQWNGTAWQPLGSGCNNNVYSTVVTPDGRLFIGGLFSTANGITFPDGQAIWNGSTFIPLDVDLPSTATTFAVLMISDGTRYTGFNTTGTATSAANTTVTNSAPSYVWPRLVIRGPSSGTSRVYQIVNYTTGFSVYFNLTLSAGEVATLNFDPQNPSFTTTSQGDITSKMLPGSQPALMYLAPGVNSVSFFAASSTVTATLSWQKRYNGTADLVS